MSRPANQNGRVFQALTSQFSKAYPRFSKGLGWTCLTELRVDLDTRALTRGKVRATNAALARSWLAVCATD